MIRSMNAKRMVEKYLRPRGITDERVLRVMSQIPRHHFVPIALHERAYSDHPLPIGQDQTISQPYIVALMTQALALQGTERVLEIGTGSGYQAAILSMLAKQVFSVERIHALSVQARKNIETLEIHNISTQCSNGQMGWKEYAPYDRIIVTAAMPDQPLYLLDQLREDGMIVAPIVEDGQQKLYRYIKRPDRCEREFLCQCEFVPFINA
ncbi:MAG: protein-L-isoaspartate(D-aspartate) O-methyltransferase [Deltaproteobacteria bacterium]|nr:protein-L-isoaspartate(D-aspartate) O-methyltransferase [Deltaproteobacteria bacterium]